MFGLPLPLFAAGAVSPPLVWIDDQTFNAAANVAVNWDDEGFEQVHLLLEITAATANSGLYMRTSSDNGATFDAGAANYEHMMCLHQTGFYKESGLVTAWPLVPNGGTYGMTATPYVSHLVTVHRPYDASERTSLSSVGGHRTVNANAECFMNCFGFRDAVGRVNALRFAPVTGTITGRVQAWGIAV